MNKVCDSSCRLKKKKGQAREEQFLIGANVLLTKNYQIYRFLILQTCMSIKKSKPISMGWRKETILLAKKHKKVNLYYHFFPCGGNLQKYTQSEHLLVCHQYFLAFVCRAQHTCRMTQKILPATLGTQIFIDVIQSQPYYVSAFVGSLPSVRSFAWICR